jgi:two-component system response regulator AtoC
MAGDSESPTKIGAGKSARWRLVVFWEGGNEAIELRADARLVLGRGDDSDVCVPDESVSRRHAILSGAGGVWQVEDLGSSNGTFVAGIRLSRGVPRAVSPGSVVMLGDARFALDGGPGQAAFLGAVAAPLVEPMQRVLRMVDVVADSMLAVLLLGETGVGKGRLADEIHRRSSRAAGPFVRLNCAAVPDGLLESELFGHERGAFTGAVKAKPGILETASGGTAFLDEIGEIPSSTQAKLLHVLEHGEVQRVGAVEPRPIDVRFIAATNQSVVAGGQLRRDLYFRLAGVPLRIPPLRERVDEIPEMARSFIEEACKASRRPCPGIAEAAIAALKAYPWPGNVRELRNVVARAVLVSAGLEVRPEHLMFDAGALEPSMPAAPELPPPNLAHRQLVDARPPTADARATAPARPRGGDDTTAAATGRLDSGVREYERERIRQALELAGGHQGKAAEQLGVSRRTLTNKLNELGLPRPRKGKNDTGG